MVLFDFFHADAFRYDTKTRYARGADDCTTLVYLAGDRVADPACKQFQNSFK